MSFSTSDSPNAMSVQPTQPGKGGSQGQQAQPMPQSVSSFPAKPQYAPAQQVSGMQQSSPPNVYQQSAAALTGAQNTANRLSNFAPTSMQAAQFGPAQTMQGVGAVQSAQAPGQIDVNQLASTNFDQYMSPYTQNVINTGQADIERQRQLASNQLGAQAEAANAFGGSRQAIQEGVLAGEALRQSGSLSAQQRQQAFQTALQSGQFDIGQTQQARALSSGQEFQANQFGQQAQESAAARDQAAQANNMQAANQFATQQAQLQQAANQANYQGQFQTAGVQAGAAGQLGGLSQTGFGMGQQLGQQQMQQGLMQQGLQQRLIDAARGQYANAVNAPMESLNAPLRALGAQPNQSTTTESQKPGLLQYLQVVGSAMCWVAREVYGENDPKWLQFREWVIGYSPNWFYKAYSKYGEKMAAVVAKVPALKVVIRPFMDAKRKAMGYK